MSPVVIKTIYKNDIRKYRGDSNYVSLINFVNKSYNLKDVSFRLTYIDREDEAVTIDQDELDDAINTYRELNKSLKINVVIIVKKNIAKKNHNSSQKPVQSYALLQQRKAAQEEIVMQKLKALKPSTSAPKYVHQKCINVWKKQEISTEKIQKNKYWDGRDDEKVEYDKRKIKIEKEKLEKEKRKQEREKKKNNNVNSTSRKRKRRNLELDKNNQKLTKLWNIDVNKNSEENNNLIQPQKKRQKIDNDNTNNQVMDVEDS